MVQLLCWVSFAELVGAGGVGFGQRFGCGDLGVDGGAVFVGFGAIGIFGDEVGVGAEGVEPEAMVHEKAGAGQSRLVWIGGRDGGHGLSMAWRSSAETSNKFQRFAGQGLGRTWTRQ